MKVTVLVMKNSLGVIAGDQDFKPEVLIAAFIQKRKHSAVSSMVSKPCSNYSPV